MINWFGVAGTFEVLGANADGTSRVRLHETSPPDVSRRFLRLLIAYTP